VVGVDERVVLRRDAGVAAPQVLDDVQRVGDGQLGAVALDPRQAEVEPLAVVQRCPDEAEVLEQGVRERDVEPVEMLAEAQRVSQGCTEF
jgi:hypothetical protein